MVFYDTVVTFLMTLLMNKFTSIVMNDWNLDEIHADYWNKVSYILYPNNSVMKYCHEWLNPWIEKSLSKW